MNATIQMSEVGFSLLIPSNSTFGPAHKHVRRNQLLSQRYVGYKLPFNTKSLNLKKSTTKTEHSVTFVAQLSVRLR